MLDFEVMWKQFSFHRHFKPADKGGAVVVWKRDLYIQEANCQLSDNHFYQRLDADPIQQDQKIIENTIKDMIASCELPPMAKHLVVTTPRTSRFYMLPKIHKPNNPGCPIVSACCSQPRTSQRTLMRWWLPSLNNFRLMSKIQTMLLASLTHSLSMNLINFLAFFSPWTSNRCILSSPTTADYRLSPISLTKGLLRSHLHTPWFAWRSWYWPSMLFPLMTDTTAKLVELRWAVEWGPITRVCLSDT